MCVYMNCVHIYGMCVLVSVSLYLRMRGQETQAVPGEVQVGH